jgi:hypothetical protein
LHVDATGFKTFKSVGPRAASFTVWGFGEAARFAKVAGLREATCIGDFLCFDEPLKMSDSQPASLTSIGRSTNAAITAMTVRRRGTPKPDPANFLPDDGNLCFPQIDFPFAALRQHDINRDFKLGDTENILRVRMDDRDKNS